jgi:hypothetical protein
VFDEAVCGEPADVAKESELGSVDGVVLRVMEDGNDCALVPMLRMICADLVGSSSISSRVMDGNSALSTAWKGMYIRSR